MRDKSAAGGKILRPRQWTADEQANTAIAKLLRDAYPILHELLRERNLAGRRRGRRNLWIIDRSTAQ